MTAVLVWCCPPMREALRMNDEIADRRSPVTPLHRKAVATCLAYLNTGHCPFCGEARPVEARS